MKFIFDPSMVLFLPLYELDGSSFASKDKQGHLATVTGALWTPQGRSFDGVDDYVSVADSPVWDFGTGDFTWIVWVKKTANTGVMMSLHPFATRYGLATSGLAFGVYDGIAAVWMPWDDVTLALNTWGHLVLVRESGVLKLAKDAVFSATTYANTTNITLREGVTLGASSPTSEYFNGLKGEVYIYDRALTALEMQHNYLATKWRYQ